MKRIDCNSGRFGHHRAVALLPVQARFAPILRPTGAGSLSPIMVRILHRDFAIWCITIDWCRSRYCWKLFESS